MMCALCGLREAAVFLRRSRPGSSANQALCEVCALSRGISASPGRLELRIEELLDPANGEKPAAQTCPVCGLTLEAFRRERRIGCPSCVAAFHAELPRLRRPAEIPPPPQAHTRGQDPQAQTASESRLLALSKALAEENYEEAARLRDLLPPSRSNSAIPAVGQPDPGPASDIVIWSRGRLDRNFADLPFPGSPRAGTGQGAARGLSILWELFGSEPQSPVELGEAERLALAEAGLLSPSFAAAKGARVLRIEPWPVGGAGRRETEAAAPKDGLGSQTFLGVFDDENHLSLRMELPGFAAAEVEKALSASGDRLDSSMAPAYDAELGYLCSSLADCGRGLRLSFLLHLPALERAGLLERSLKAALARGFALRGRYGRGESSAGELYELTTEEGSVALDGAELAEAAIRLARAERQARAQLLSEARDELLDRLARALGTALYARRLPEAEAIELLSELRLGLLCGLLRGLDPTELARLMDAMGPVRLGIEAESRGLSLPEGFIAQGRGAGGLKPPGGAAREALRAELMRKLVSTAILEGGS